MGNFLLVLLIVSVSWNLYILGRYLLERFPSERKPPSCDRPVKQVLVVRKDLNMRKGKIAAQAAHASMKVLLDVMGTRRYRFRKYFSKILNVSEGSALDIWLSGSFTKVCVSVDSEEDLVRIFNAARDVGLLSTMIEDNGWTEFKGVRTKTAVAIGPAFSDEIDPITSHLKLL